MSLLILKEGKIPVKKDNFSFVRTNTVIVIFDKLGREEEGKKLSLPQGVF